MVLRIFERVATSGLLTASELPNSFPPGLRPAPHWGSLQRCSRPFSWFKVPTSKGRGRGKTGERERRRGEEGEGPPLAQIHGSAPEPESDRG